MSAAPVEAVTPDPVTYPVEVPVSDDGNETFYATRWAVRFTTPTPTGPMLTVSPLFDSASDAHLWLTAVRVGIDLANAYIGE